MKKTFSVFLILVLLGCETVVDVDVPRNPSKLVINSTLTPDGFIRVNLSESRYILDENDFQLISGAKVDVYEDGLLLETLPDSTYGNYISGIHKPGHGKTYKIVASKSGYDDVSAEVKIPLDTVIVSSIVIDTVEINDFGYTSSYLRFNIDLIDNPDVDNFYGVSLLEEFYEYQYDYSVDPPTLIDSTFRTYNSYIQSRDPIFEDYQAYSDNLVFNDELMYNGSYILRILTHNDEYYSENPYPYISPKKYTVVLNNTSESYYLYNTTLALQYWTSDNPFAQPVQVYTNVNNGYGILDAYNTSSHKVNE